jgi:4-aminobutyrate aminotransferase-like enzyme
MVAMEFFKDAERRVPDPELPKALVSKAAEQGLILLSCGMYGNVIRILVPLTATDTQVDEGLSIIEKCLTS